MTLPEAGNLAQVLSFPFAVLLWAATQRIAPRFWKKWAGPVLSTAAVVTLVALWRSRILNSLGARLHVPGWLVLVLGLLAVLVSLICWSLTHAGKAQRDWRDYVSDELLGLVWHWRYARNEIQELSLSAFCPHCRHRLQPQQDADHRPPGPKTAPVTLLCPHCGFKREFDSHFDQLKAKVIAEIERRLNTGEYRQRIDTDS